MSNFPSIATRSAGPAPTMSRKMCVRCSKQLGIDHNIICDKRPDANCARCRQLHKVCDEVPERFIPQFNRVFGIAQQQHANATATPPVLNPQNAHTLVDELRRYRQAVEDFFRRAVTRRRNTPNSMGEAAVLLNDTLTRIAETMDGLHDVLRYSVILSSSHRVFS